MFLKGMDRPSAVAIASMLLTAPAWARVGLTVRDERLRVWAAHCLASTIVTALDEAPLADERQMTLTL